MKHTRLAFVALILIHILPCLGSSIPFTPIAKHYTSVHYNAGSQNWSVAQDKQGIMYFGNNKGLLEFDGNRWQLYPISTNGIIRSVYIANDNKIYVGSYEEFGYFQRDELNKLKYHSLKQDVKDFSFHNDEIWNILENDSRIIFHSFGSYFIYDGTTTVGHRVSQLPLNLFRVGETLFSQQINAGLNIFTNNSFQSIISRQQLGDSDVISGIPNGEDILFFTRNSGIFRYNGKHVTPWVTPCDKELKNYTINKVTITKDSCYIVGTLSNGVYAINKEGKLLWKQNADNQLVNNTVLNLYCDSHNNIWVTLDNGIAYIQNNSPVYHFEPVSRKMGMIYSILVKENDAYIASNQGLYYLKGNTDKPKLIPGLEEQAWTLKQWGGQVICGHNKGTFSIVNGHPVSISNIRGAMCMKEGKIDNEELLIQGTYTYLNIYKKNANRQWYYSGSINNFVHMAKNVEIDHRGNVWVEHMRSGLYRVRLNREHTRATDVKRYHSLDGQPRSKTFLFNINGRVAFSDGKQFYTYDDIIDTIIPYKSMNEQLAHVKGVHTVDKAHDDFYWFLSDHEAYLIECTLTHFHVHQRLSFAMFDNPPIEERAKMIYDENSKCSYLCLNNSIARVALDNLNLYNEASEPVLRVSELNAFKEKTAETLLFPPVPNNKIPSAYNNIRINLSFPIYNDFSLKIRYKLEGLSDYWTEGLPEYQKEYTRLPFGKYCFKADIYNEQGELSSISFPFEILRPWYLSYLAIVVYILIGLCLLALLMYTVYVYTKRKKDAVIEKQRIRHHSELEKQEKKIIELEKQQLEVDLKFKSKELSGVIMTNIAHQEFLMALKTEIQQQKLSGQYTRKNLDRLLALLNQNLVSDEESWSMFQANFDRIHENFFRHLKEQFPDLTSGDLRLCGLLRLNLPTKEISKLMNISIRGVDAARYRLRKKLGISQESSLTDFMINFK